MQLSISTKRFWHLAKCQKVRMGLYAIRGIHGMHIPTTSDIHMHRAAYSCLLLLSLKNTSGVFLTERVFSYI